MSDSTPVRQRVFFALLPAQELAREIWTCADRCIPDSDARRVSSASLHMTLVFLGELSENQVEHAIGVAYGVATPPFAFDLVRCEHRSRQAIVWLRGQSSSALDMLVAALRDGLDAAGVPFDRKPFLPHVTLARNARSGSRLDCALRWPVREFVLMRSSQTTNGSRYQVIMRWPLTG